MTHKHCAAVSCCNGSRVVHPRMSKHQQTSKFVCSMATKAFSLFADERIDHSKVVKQLLSDEVPAIPKAKPHRPISANPIAGAGKPATSKHKHKVQHNTSARDEINKVSREDLITELQELKKKHRSLEESYNHIKAENQRLESDATKQQRRIDQLLNLSEGAKNIGISAEMRRDIEKSILVRQLKNQINNLRNDFAEKENELEALKRGIKSTHVAELTFERDEYFLEVQRLKAALMDTKDELQRERQRREWNTRVAGDASEDLRREVARLSSGYQHMLANISTRATTSSGQRPSTTTGTRPGFAGGAELSPALTAVRPVSATATSSGHSPTRDGERPKRPLSATSRNTPLSAYYQPGQSVEGEGLGGVDPLDNFGLPSHAAGKPSEGGDKLAIQEILQAAERSASSAAIPTRGDENAGIFAIGERVQGQFQGGASWYNGEIRKFNSSDGSYHVQYDDGDYETDVPLSRLRAVALAVDAAGETTTASMQRQVPAVVPTLAAAPASHPALLAGANTGFAQPSPTKPKPPLTAAPYKVGDKVEALYYKGTTWYGGKVQAVHVAANPAEGEYVFDIAYDDGDRELKVPVSNIRPKGGAAAAPSTTTPAPAQVTATAPNASAPAHADTAPSRATVNGEASPKPPVASAPAAPPAKFQVGDRVEGYYGGGPNWYPGKISKVTTNSAGPSYSIDYDDGDREVNVAEGNVRSLPDVPTTATASERPSPRPAAENPFKKDDRVQGYFDDLATWFDGTVVSTGDDTCHIAYDDGDEEPSKPVSKIRLLPNPVSPPRQSSPVKPAATVAPAAELSPRAPTAATSQPPSVQSRFKVNDRVEGRFGNGDDWYPAVITGVTNPGPAALYALEYDDGDKEDLVDDSCIRLMDVPQAQITPQKEPVVTRVTPTAARKPSIVNTNLDSFLNELSDDEDDHSNGGLGQLDSGRGVTLRPTLGGEPVAASTEPTKADDEDAYEEDFDA